MVKQFWNFDGKEVLGTDGSVLHWEDHRYFTITYGGHTFHGEIMENKIESNYLKIKINHRIFEVNKKGELDDLIASLGMDKPKVKKLKEMQAPMPGRIVNVAVAVGDEINPGDEVLSLEAMKMENVLKAEGVGKVKSILVGMDDVVDKGSVLIEFE